VANAASAYVVAQLVSRGGSEARLDGIRDVARFLLAALAGGVTTALIGGVTALLIVDADLWSTCISLFASHGSALLVVAPLGLVSLRLRRGARPHEVVLQLFIFVVLLVLVFWPGTVRPLSFVPLAALLWAAFRRPTLVVAVELSVMGIVATRLTDLGGGPFADYAVSDPAVAIGLLQNFLVIYAGAALSVSAARNDWGALVVQLSAREALLRGGMIGAETGILIAEVVDGDHLRVVGVNAAALAALRLDTAPATWTASGVRIARDRAVLGVPDLDELISEGRSGCVEVVSDGRRFDVDVAMHDGATEKNVFTVVFTDVTQRDERERRALDVAEQLRDLNRQKDDVISSVSHELRTPVTSILGFVEDLESAQLEPGERVATEVIRRNARRLADVIDDVLELSKLSSGAAIARPAGPLDLRMILEQCIEDASGLAPSRQIRLRLDAPSGPVMISTVASDLARVLANLLSNAVKFSPDDGEVVVTLHEHKHEGKPEHEPAYERGWRITIVDHGMGTPPDQIAHVWERFSRVQSERHRAIDGTGLGLPIVRELVERRLRGTVKLESDGITGTTAILELPTERGDAASTPEQTTAPHGLAPLASD